MRKKPQESCLIWKQEPRDEDKVVPEAIAAFESDCEIRWGGEIMGHFSLPFFTAFPPPTILTSAQNKGGDSQLSQFSAFTGVAITTNQFQNIFFFTKRETEDIIHYLCGNLSAVSSTLQNVVKSSAQSNIEEGTCVYVQETEEGRGAF